MSTWLDMPEYHEGYNDYLKRNLNNPYNPNSVKAQAWDRGAQDAMKDLKIIENLEDE